MRGYALAMVLSLVFAAGCGGGELTNEQVADMKDDDALAMADCQMRKAAEDLGQQEAINRYGDALIGSAENDSDTLQVILHNDGYRCPEYLS